MGFKRLIVILASSLLFFAVGSTEATVLNLPRLISLWKTAKADSSQSTAQCRVTLLDIFLESRRQDFPFDMADLLQIEGMDSDVKDSMNVVVRAFAPFLPPAHGLFKAAVWARKQENMTGSEIFPKMLEWLDTQSSLRPGDLEKIPKDGPVLIIADHPMGLIDGVLLGDIISRVRSDFKMMTLTLLEKAAEQDPRFKNYLIFVKRKAKTPEEKQLNTRAIGELVRFMKRQYGAAVIFPSGSVSVRNEKGELVDPVWEENIVAIARLTNATIIPIKITGQNPDYYYQAQEIDPRLRRLFYARNLYNKRGQIVPISIGDPIRYLDLAPLGSNENIIQELRSRINNLR